MAGRFRSVNIWREMTPGAVRRFGVAVFLTFAALGLVSILIESSIRFFSWSFVAVQAVASGGMAATIVLLGRRRWWVIVPAMVFWGGIMVLNGGGLSFVFSEEEGLRVRLNGIARESPALNPRPEEAVPTKAELDAIFAQRGIIGAAVIVLLVSGYTMFVSVIRNEIKRRASLQAEVRIAQDIQQSLLPPRTLETSSCSIAGIAIPANEVGGDYYDVVCLSDGRVALAIADVTGHGVGAGILSAMTKSALRLQLGYSPDPDAVMTHLNHAVYEVSDEKTFVTFAYALVDPAEGRVALATAGHPPILHRSAATGAVTPIRLKSPALGMRRDVKFAPATSIRYEPGDLLLLYTDGLLEATDGRGLQFGAEGLNASLQRLEGTPEEIVRAIIAEVRRFAPKIDGFEDDVSVVCLRMKGRA